MSMVINLLITAGIFALAGYYLYRTIKRSKQGKCAACDYQCEAKKLADAAKKQVQ